MSAKTPYIGSKISLISKAEIRYEGVLYAVDTKEATVTLAKVRSFGTEDRQVPKPIPPRTETYEFIIFRGSDIKDLHVSEIAPKTEDAPQDPAIVSATSQIPLIMPPSNDPPPPASSSSQPLLPPSQPPTYSPFPPAPGAFSPFSVPYFKPQVMMGTGGPAAMQRPPPPPNLPPPTAVPHSMPPSTHQPFPPFIQGQVPVPLSQKSPFVGSNLPTSTTSAPVISTIMRPSPGTAGEGGKNQSSPVASSTPQAATGAAAKTQTSEAHTTPQAASESESPLARMNPVSPASQVTQAPPPSALSHGMPSQDPTPVLIPEQMVQPTHSKSDNQPPPTSTQAMTGGGSAEEKQISNNGKAPLISEPPTSISHHTVNNDRRTGSNAISATRTDRSRGRGGRKNSRGSSRGGARGGAPYNHQEPSYRYENDFDFESANAQFNKQVLEEEFRRLHVSKGKPAEDGAGDEPLEAGEEEEEGEMEEVEEGEVMGEEEVEFYDKSKSFFDNISCENPGGSGNRRPNWNEERELNTETFGVSSVNRLRRGRGRGRWRGRGRGRDGYRRRDYNNRGWHREEGRDGEDRPPRGGRRGGWGGGGYSQRGSAGGYRGRGRRGGRGGQRDSVERQATTAGGGEQ